MNTSCVVVRLTRPAMVVSVLLALCGAAAGQQNFGVTVNSSGATGSNHTAAHALRTGTGVGIGILEVSDTDFNNNPTLGIIPGNLGARLGSQWDFQGLAPGFIGPIPAAPGTGDHATMVSSCAAANPIAAGGGYPGFVGVARGANVYFGGIDTYDSVRLATSYIRQNHGTNLFNASWGSANFNNGGQNDNAIYMDWFQNRYDGLIVKSAGNTGHINMGAGVFNNGLKQVSAPGDFYNGITVGATDQTFRMRATYSSYWLTGDTGLVPDGRCKPDIVAPGTGMDDNVSYPAPNTRPSRGTSFAAPHVTGAAALLVQNGLGLGGGPGAGARPPSNHTAIKALILNSARKRGISGTNSANATAEDYTGGFSNVTRTDDECSDENYLNAGNNALVAGMTPASVVAGNGRATATSQWTPSRWERNSGTQGALFAWRPLDDEQGTGLLDAHRALVNMNGGEQNPGPINPIGWDRDSIAGNGNIKSYDFNFSIPAGSFVTATLCWDRLITETNAAGGLMDKVDLGDTYGPTGGATINGLADLDLKFRYHGVMGNFLLAASLSTVDNVEHLHIPTSIAINPGELSIDVSLFNANGLGTIDYGLAWWTVPTPGATMLLALAGIAAARRRRERIA